MGNANGKQESVGTDEGDDALDQRGPLGIDPSAASSAPNSPRAKGGLSNNPDGKSFHINVKIEQQIYMIRVPNAYTTTGWLLREATQRFLAENGDPGVVALQR